MSYQKMKDNQRWITVKDKHGRILKDGIDERYHDQDYPKCALGIPIFTWIKYTSAISVFIVAIYNGSTIFNKLNDGITELKFGQHQVSTKLDYLNEWTQSNDHFWGDYFKFPFKGGKPETKQYFEWIKAHGGKR